MSTLTYSLETEANADGVTVYILPPNCIEITAQRERLRVGRWTLYPRQKDRIALAVQEERGAIVSCQDFAQAITLCRWFSQTFGGDE